MRPPDDPEIAAWMEKSRRDLVMAETALDDEWRFWDQACFHSQQAGEKALKALQAAIGIVPTRTHDLVLIAQALRVAIALPESVLEACGRLSQYSVTPRYPSFLAPETEDQARQALARAREIVAFTQQQLGSKA